LVSEVPLGPVTSLPRNRTTSPTSRSSLGTGVLLGLQAFGALVGTASAAHAAPTVTPQDFQAKLAELEATKDTMTPSELATARRDLYRSFLASTSAPQSSTTTTAATFPFEATWAKAEPGSIDRAMVDAAIKQMGKEGTEDKVIELLETHDARLSPQAKADLQVIAAGRAIAADAVDGGLTKDELGQIEARLATKMGAGEATTAILRAFPAHTDALDDGAIEHLLTRAATVTTHGARIQSVVDEMMAGKNQIIDVNADGQIDKGDVVLTKTDAGKALVQRITSKFADETKVSAAMVTASEKMNGAGVSFQLMKNHKANPDFWNVDSYGTLTLKPGVKASDAMNDMITNGSKYGFECATGLVVVYYQAALDLIGPKDFDRAMSDLRIGPWEFENDLEPMIINSHPNPGKGVETELGDKQLTPGQYYYFRNWDVTDEAKARGWQGENVIYLGEGKFCGHGIGLGQGEDFVRKLSGEMKEGGRTPSLLNINAHLSTDVLELDLNPGQ